METALPGKSQSDSQKSVRACRLHPPSLTSKGVGGGGGSVLFARQNYTVPECLIVKIRFLLPQNVRKKVYNPSSISHRTVRIRNKEFLEPHINFMQNKLLTLNEIFT